MTDCDQEYLLLFLYGIGEERITDRPEEADVVLADRYLLLGQGKTGRNWTRMHGSCTRRVMNLHSLWKRPVCSRVYENDRFVLYQK